MDARDILKRPVITERSTDLMSEKKYTFEVDVRANKTQVKDAVEEIFGVDVDKVNIMNYKAPRSVMRLSRRLGRWICKTYSFYLYAFEMPGAELSLGGPRC
jgi:ribosomal protein L23